MRQGHVAMVCRGRTLSGQRLLRQRSGLNGELAERGLIQPVGCRILGREIHDDSWIFMGFLSVQFPVFLAAGAYGVAVVHFKIQSRTRGDLVISAGEKVTKS